MRGQPSSIWRPEQEREDWCGTKDIRPLGERKLRADTPSSVLAQTLGANSSHTSSQTPLWHKGSSPDALSQRPAGSRACGAP